MNRISTSTFLSVIRKGDTVIDVGANVGFLVIIGGASWINKEDYRL